MRVLFVGDMHLRINTFTLATDFLSWLNRFIDEQKPDLVVALGDALHDHAVIRSEVLNELMNHIYYVTDQKIPYVYLKGNHDQFTPKDGKYHALLPFKDRIDNLYVVDEIQDLFGMTFVPFLANGEDFPKVTLPICVAHQTFLGADYGPINSKEGVDPDSVSAEIIISGHIHKRHNLGKVVYVGSPYSQGAADINQIKGVSMFNTDTFQFTFYETPFPGWKTFEYELNSENSVEKLHKELSEQLLGTNDYWIVELTGPKAEIISYLDSKEYKQLIKQVNIRPKTTFTDKQKQKVSISSVSMGQIVSEFVDKVYNGSLDKEEILSNAQAILEEVRAS